MSQCRFSWQSSVYGSVRCEQDNDAHYLRHTMQDSWVAVGSESSAPGGFWVPEESPAPDPGTLILAIEQAKEGIAAFTDLRTEFIERGWSEQGAESMVYAMFMNGGRHA